MSEIKVDVCVYAFDMLYHNGRPLIQEELKVRREVSLFCLYLIMFKNFDAMFFGSNNC